MSIKIASMNFGDCDTILHNTPNGMKNIAEVLGPNGEVYWSAIKEITGIPPLSIRSNGTILLDYLISGNMSQNDTPTPTTPIQPQETGERTGNLFDGDNWYSAYKVSTGVYSGTVNNFYVINCKPFKTDDVGKTFTFCVKMTNVTSTNIRVHFTSEGVVTNGNNLSADGYSSVTFTVSSTDDSVGIGYGAGGGNAITFSEIMLNTGSTALPYEPYGIKIPISSGGENLWDEDYTEISPSIKYLPILVGDGTFTLSSTTPLPSNGAACLFFFSGSVDSGAGPQNRVYLNNPRTVDSIDGYVTIAYRITSYDPRDYTTMLNLGSTPLPYSPYNRTTTPIYLGEVPTTRRIKKLVLTGDENWAKYAVTEESYLYYLTGLFVSPVNDCICTHVTYSSIIPNGNKQGVRISDSRTTLLLNCGTEVMSENTTAAFKTYLQQQYTAGTPVTIWYVLTEPTTGIVNEPLRKIGNYADTVSMEQAGVQIPTIKGNTVIDVETTLKPSQMYIKYK